MRTFCSLANCADGSEPSSEPIQGSDGDSCGTTRWGGTFGGGVVYDITSAGRFNVVKTFCSRTYFKATVPAGATSGTVSVVSASGTFNSYPQFVVTK